MRPPRRPSPPADRTAGTRGDPGGPSGAASGGASRAATRGPSGAESGGGGVRLHGLTRRFGDVTAVDALGFEVRAGELFGLVGPDGAGKTTTLRMLAGILRPTAGRAEVAGVRIEEDPEAAKPLIAYMAQRFGLYEDLTVEENLAFYADLFRVPKTERPARLERLYRFSRLGGFRARRAGALSGGMKQKLALSCCLVHRPRILLLDEPTFGVDPISRRELWLILHEMVSAGTTVLVSTSYLDEAERCDRVALLHEGRLLALDTPAALQAAMPGRLVRVEGGAGGPAETGGRAEDPRALRDRLRKAPGVAGAALFGETLHVRLEQGIQWDELASAIAGLDGLDAEEVEPSLEDVFIERVGRA